MGGTRQADSRRQVVRLAAGIPNKKYGYFLLGLIIERAGGASYAEQLQDRICAPAGMTHTRGDDNDAFRRLHAVANNPNSCYNLQMCVVYEVTAL
ncbi:MAG: serine hydrolase [Candidatus Eisenbacteria bacterium]|uniref:Serine hydrolase n=1 Tax=Eiseniibacteriota bacterium TaxID=2212470 RepID=A0A948S0H2_UNCEI|nr:serine hydrolase [Candidatus Eisenbacteria bacterium]MBU1948104.1 serine hydrolase [Candidatus Eisenbacteria bacterium]MBU2692577.1 serine hydrolase [Candidatus Eisenbacteria bacterium]